MNLLGPPTISRSHFIDILTEGTSAGPSPCASQGGLAFDIILRSGLNPAILLAIFGKESQYGVTGYAPKTKNWGNVRHAYHPDWEVGRHPADFAIFADWMTSLRDLCDRLVFRYIGEWKLTTVETAIARYAPSTENDTQGYITFVLDHVALWQAQEQGGNMTDSIGYADETLLLDMGANRPGIKLTGFHAWTQHETGNEAATANARMHRRYWNTGGSGRWVSSIHFCGDEAEVLQFIPTDELAWHIGDGADEPYKDEAFFTVGSEICVNSRKGFVSACERMAKVAAKVLRAKGVQPLDGVTIRKHGSYPATTHDRCPAHLNAGDWGITWSEYVGLIVKNYGGVVEPHPKYLFYTTTDDAFVRQGPNRKYEPPVMLVPAGTRAGYDSEKTGESINGNNVWRHRADGLGFTWSGLLVRS